MEIAAHQRYLPDGDIGVGLGEKAEEKQKAKPVSGRHVTHY